MAIAWDVHAELETDARRILLRQARAIGLLLGHRRITAEHLHEARRQMKRMRAVLDALRTGVQAATRRRLKQQLRELAHLLAPSREAQVLSEGLQAGSRGDSFLPAALARRLRERAARELASAERGVRSQLPSVRDRTRAIAGMVRGIRCAGGMAVVWSGLETALRRAADAARFALGGDDVEPRHAWRKRVQSLWHQVHMLEPAWPATIDAWADELHRLSDLLGDEHDLHELAAWIGNDHAIGAGTARSARGRLATRAARHAREADRLGERLFAEAPEDTVARVRAWWRIHRDEPRRSDVP